MEKDGREVKVVKLGEFKINDYNVLVINKTDYSGEDKIDFRVWSNSMKYKGPTKQGFVLKIDQMKDFIELVKSMQETLGLDSEKKPTKKKVAKTKSTKKSK